MLTKENPDISASLQAWNELHELYQVNGRKLPESFADRLRLEVFWLGVEKALRGDKSLHKKYVELGLAVDGAWFRESLVPEQGFIYQALHRKYLKERSMTDGNGATYEQGGKESDLRR